MKYTNGGAFRRALEDRLRARSLQTGMPLVRLRKMVSFDRFLARLLFLQADKWVLKGGLALQLRLGERARTTKDIDMLTFAQRRAIFPALRSAGALDLGDWFIFEVTDTLESTSRDFGGMRYQLSALLDGRTFEKFHAYTLSHSSGASTRVKDMVDILLLADMGEIDSERLLLAIHATFDIRQTHILPNRLPQPPGNWSKPFQRMVEEVELGYGSLDEANEAMRQFLYPVLSGEIKGTWDPNHWNWR